MIILQSIITCPECKFQSMETMPTRSCVHLYTCKHCGTELKPKPGYCCVFCSYGNVKCPPIQKNRAGC